MFRIERGCQKMRYILRVVTVQRLAWTFQRDVAYFSIQEKVRCSPKGFVRKGNERKRERERGGGGEWPGSRETSSKTNWLEGPH